MSPTYTLGVATDIPIPGRAQRLGPLLFWATLLLSAFLLFAVQPLFARMALPLLGGSPGVWNTALLFFQGLLLAAYAAVHGLAARLGPRRQVGLHLVALLLPVLVLPIALPLGAVPPAEHDPTLWLLGLMATAVGLPYFAVACSSPLLQRWFASSGHPAAGDPYFLFAASNLGSLAGLLAYPLLVEPRWSLEAQARGWTLGYGLLVLLLLCCAAWTLGWGHGRPSAAGPASAATPDADAGPAGPALAPPLSRRLWWAALAALPSSLMIGATTAISTDLASFPLLWLPPLGLYLLSFVLVFARRRLLPARLVARTLPMVALPLAVALALGANQPVGVLLALHLLFLFVAALACHGRLADDRPAPRHLTAFYLWISLGGVLGGLCNVLLAPQLFRSIAEYPIALVLACLLGLPPPADPPALAPRRALFDLLLPSMLTAAVAALLLAPQARSMAVYPVLGSLVFPLAGLVAFGFSRRRLRFSLAMAGILLVGQPYTQSLGSLLYAERSFYGVSRVRLSPDGSQRLLFHGSSLHGAQSTRPAARPEPLTYYARTGPLGWLFQALEPRLAGQAVGAVGLGAGAIACYAEPGQTWTFFELDPTVARIARDPRYFSFLAACAPEARLVLGDARLTLGRAAEAGFGLLVLDAYSSDAIPLHLITREALDLYLAKLRPDGLLAFHISNRHLDLEPVLGRLAQSAGLQALVAEDLDPAESALEAGAYPAIYLVMAREEAALKPLRGDPRWRPARADGPLWTDDFASVLGALRR